MAFYERNYFEIKRENSAMEIVGVRSEGIEQDEVAQYLRKRNARTKRAPILNGLAVAFMWLLASTPIILDLLFSYQHRVSSFSIGASVFFALMAIFITVVVIKKGGLIRGELFDPDSPEAQKALAGEALDKKLFKKYGLCEAHDLVSVDSVLTNSTAFIGSFPPALNAQRQAQRANESATLLQYARKQGLAHTAAPQKASGSVAPRVVDLRSDAERAVERDAGNALAPEREQLAQDMVAFLKTHDTGNNMDDYREFRSLFHERSEAIAAGGGYHQALQEIYYRIRQLCGEQGVYFHAGGVDNVFNGEYWRS